MGARVYPSDIYEEVGTSMRKVLCCAGAIAGAVLAVSASAAMADEYVVLYKQDAGTAAAHQAIRDAGGTIVSENTDVSVATVSSSDRALENARLCSTDNANHASVESCSDRTAAAKSTSRACIRASAGLGLIWSRWI